MTLSRAWSMVLLMVGTVGVARPAAAQVYALADMNTRQIQALDRQRTVVLIPGGILEEHGPYLPSYTDGYAVEAYTRALATAIVARPGWTVVVFPQGPGEHDRGETHFSQAVSSGIFACVCERYAIRRRGGYWTKGTALWDFSPRPDPPERIHNGQAVPVALFKEIPKRSSPL